MLQIEQKWSVDHNVFDPNTNSPYHFTYNIVHNYSANPTWWSSELKPGYSPGVVIGRKAGSYFYPRTAGCGQLPDTLYSDTLTRLTFIGAEGTEFEFRDALTGGEPKRITSPCVTQGFNRGRVFIAADGSGATFISDEDIFDAIYPGGGDTFHPSGNLLHKDGARYRIELGRVTEVKDRNGNRIRYTQSHGSPLVITDSINRVVTITYSGEYDEISWKGANGNQRHIRVYWANLSQTLRAGETQKRFNELFPLLYTQPFTIPLFEARVPSQVLLPDGRSYYFKYNSYGELARVELPTGGVIEYDWWPGLGTAGSGGVVEVQRSNGLVYPEAAPEYDIIRRVKERRLYVSNGALESRTVYGLPNTIFSPDPMTDVTVESFNASGQTTQKSKHYYSGYPADSSSLAPINYPAWNEGREVQTEQFAQDGSTVLSRINQTWQQRAAVGWYQSGPYQGGAVGAGPEPSNDPRLTEVMTTLADANLVSRQTFGYDQYNNQTDVYSYGFGAGAPGPLIRQTRTDYVTLNNGVDYAADTNIHIRNLPRQMQVIDAGEIKRAETVYHYDLYDNSPNHAPLIDRPGISGLDSSFTTGYTTRGNVIGTSRALLDNNGAVTGWVNSHAQYDIAGNVVKVIDAKDKATQFDFRDNFGSPDDPVVQSSDNPANNAPGELGGQMSYAFPFKITNALGHKTYTKYDYYLGRPALSEDVNGVKSNIYFNDALDRPTRGVRAIGTSVASQTVFVYNDSDSPVNGHPAHSITTISDKDIFGESASGNGLISVALYDGLGRMWRGATYEGSTWSITDTRFDALGRVSQVSNPYHAADPGSASAQSGLWTTTKYDALGRVIRVTTPDTAAVNTEYSGNRTLVIDQAGVKRISQTDALGRLTNIWEVRSPHTASGTVSVSFPNHPEITAGYQTDYLYDSLGNLRKVTQGVQTRWFAYDSLSRLIRVKNPEQNTNSSLPPHTDPVTEGSGWAMAYSYDANGNLVSKTDARNITTTYGYDALNRNESVDYWDTAINPDITRFYDKPTVGAYGKGRFWHDHAGGDWFTAPNVEHTAIDSYDPLGRPLAKRQVFKHNGIVGPHYSVNQTYDLAGAVKTMSYPSGRTVKYSYDQAGRLSSFSGNLGGSARTYADKIDHNAAGQMIKERFGTNTSLYHNRHYNNRMQLVDIRLGDSATDEWNWSRGAIALYYSTTAAASWNGFANDTDNNGNLRRQITWVPLAGGGHVNPQHDDYTYDALNRVSSFTEAQMDSGGQWTLNVASQNFSYDRYGNRKITSVIGDVNNYNPTYDPGSNRIVGPGYDQSGNITSDMSTGGTMIYDAENRLLTASAGGGGTYTYDANGKRSRRTAVGQETWYVYGIGGELLAEYAAGAQPTAPQKEYGYRNGQLLVIAEPGSGGNLAWGKATSQSSTWSAGNSSRAVDGNTNGNYFDNSVSTTNSEHQPWWQVDLGSVQQLGTVKLWNRTDCCSARLTAFYVLVSDNPFSSTDLATTINQAGVSSYYTVGPAGLLTEIGVGRSGRYVRVQLAGENYLQLAEVEVMAGTASGEAVKWLMTDHLGSTRMVIDQTGSLAGIKRHDFLPFGEELSAGIGIRSAALGYGPDSTRQKFTGKERDDETGLDYFINRYHSSVQGRFTSVDPIFFQKEMLVDPQRFNLYAYTRNNPLRFVDPNGEAIELLGDEEKRKKILEGLREIVGKQAGAYLYENKITDKDGNTRYFVGIYKNGHDGKGADFGAINKVSSQIGRIINDTRVASVNLVEPGTKYTATSPDGRTETRIVGPLQPNSGNSPGLTDSFTGNITMLDPKYAYGALPGSVMSNGVDNDPGFATALAHEFGHIQFAWGHSMGSSNDSAVGLENEVRRLKNPSGPTRTRHNPGDPDVGTAVKGGSVIKCPGCAIR